MAKWRAAWYRITNGSATNFNNQRMMFWNCLFAENKPRSTPISAILINVNTCINIFHNKNNFSVACPPKQLFLYLRSYCNLRTIVGWLAKLLRNNMLYFKKIILHWRLRHLHVIFRTSHLTLLEIELPVMGFGSPERFCPLWKIFELLSSFSFLLTLPLRSYGDLILQLDSRGAISPWIGYKRRVGPQLIGY